MREGERQRNPLHGNRRFDVGERVAPLPAEHDHVVQFYDCDEDLLQLVGAYFTDGLELDDAILVVATPGHRRGFEKRLAATGVDVEAAVARGAYVALDAEKTLRRITLTTR